MNYIKDSIDEIKKVTWPTSNQAIKICIITVVFTLISALAITGLDFSFRKGYDQVLEMSPKVQQDRENLGQTQAEAPEAAINLGSEIQATDADGNPVNLNVTPTAVPTAQ